ncbi:hypothetical protein SAMN04488047_13717 [Tranquillimonas alkanivorans]|uniref:Uncharacterized protein n=1 Tax=Tranquillimonas alkanivorans TaxID=441119 RepID=A0A1I5VZ02_9RHOB|nr:DUF6635 family protein [Tranquillimonas alkanivorans]SFQ12226.1 hypothetical protein SAMN04488047_13717 [Tranquillimonas alkanivorans]
MAETFSFGGTLRLHRRAIGGDLLRAPANVALAPLHLSLKLLALLCRGIGLRRLSGWLAARDILLRTAVSQELEARLLDRLFALRPPGQASQPTQRRLLEAPALRSLLRTSDGAEEAEARADRAAASISAYSGVRSAVAEITTAAVALMLGAVLFHSLTPGMVSMAPTLAEKVVMEAAIGSFPLGPTAGSAWYALFPAHASTPQVLTTAAALIIAGACIATFAGLVADPVQARLGIHRRRLLRLIDAVESDLAGTACRPFSAREHYYARFADVIDAGVAVLRSLR